MRSSLTVNPCVVGLAVLLVFSLIFSIWTSIFRFIALLVLVVLLWNGWLFWLVWLIWSVWNFRSFRPWFFGFRIIRLWVVWSVGLVSYMDGYIVGVCINVFYTNACASNSINV